MQYIQCDDDSVGDIEDWKKTITTIERRVHHHQLANEVSQVMCLFAHFNTGSLFFPFVTNQVEVRQKDEVPVVVIVVTLENEQLVHQNESKVASSRMMMM